MLGKLIILLPVYRVVKPAKATRKLCIQSFVWS